MTVVLICWSHWSHNTVWTRDTRDSLLLVMAPLWSHSGGELIRHSPTYFTAFWFNYSWTRFCQNPRFKFIEDVLMIDWCTVMIDNWWLLWWRLMIMMIIDVLIGLTLLGLGFRQLLVTTWYMKSTHDTFLSPQKLVFGLFCRSFLHWTIMESSENLNNKILEERQVEKFSQFIESYEEAVGNLKKKLSSNKNQPLTASTNVAENVSFYSLTGKKQF